MFSKSVMYLLIRTECGTEKKNYKVFSLERGTVCSQDMDTDKSGQTKIRNI